MLLTVFCLRRDRSEITFNLQVDADFELQNFRALCELESGIPAAESQVRACPRPERREGPGRCPRAGSGRAPSPRGVESRDPPRPPGVWGCLGGGFLPVPPLADLSRLGRNASLFSQNPLGRGLPVTCGSSGEGSVRARRAAEREKIMWVCFGLFYVAVSEESDAYTGQELERREQESELGEGGDPWAALTSGNGAEMFGEGFIDPMKLLPGLGRKGHIESFPPFLFHPGVGSEQAHPCGFPSKYSPPARIQGSLVCQNLGEAACGGGSGPSVWALLMFWVQPLVFCLSSPFVPGRVVSAPFLGAGRAWQSLWSSVVVASASRAFSQSKLTKCSSSQAKISQRWKSCCRGSPGAGVSLTQQVPS